MAACSLLWQEEVCELLLALQKMTSAPPDSNAILEFSFVSLLYGHAGRSEIL